MNVNQKRVTFPTRISVALKKKLQKRADDIELHMCDIMEAGIITVLEKPKTEIVGIIESYKGVK